MLDQHPQLCMSIDPFIPLFRAYRNALLRSVGKEQLLERVPRQALDDYYFCDAKIEIMRAVQEADPDIPFDLAAWPSVREALVSRMTLTSANLLPRLDRLPAPMFRQVFENCLEIVAEKKPGEFAWVGFNDNWAAEFFTPIAKLFPDARFILYLRDPRAVVNSSEFAEPEPRNRPTVLSLARHIRKYIALSQSFVTDPLIRDRLLITQYESFLAEPEAQLRRVVEFLDVDFRPEMLDVSRFRRADGVIVNTAWEIYRDSGDIWRTQMPAAMAELVEFICAPDMTLFGYYPERYDDTKGLSEEAFAYAVRNAHECLGWRTDFPELEHTLGCELFRKRMLKTHADFSDAEIARAFLYPKIYHQLCAKISSHSLESNSSVSL